MEEEKIVLLLNYKGGFNCGALSMINSYNQVGNKLRNPEKIE